MHQQSGVLVSSYARLIPPTLFYQGFLMLPKQIPLLLLATSRDRIETARAWLWLASRVRLMPSHPPTHFYFLQTPIRNRKAHSTTCAHRHPMSLLFQCPLPTICTQGTQLPTNQRRHQHVPTRSYSSPCHKCC